MSFSSTVKSELCRIENRDVCCMFSELAAVITVSGVVRFNRKNDCSVRITTENAAFARKVFSIIKRLYNIFPEVIIRKSRKLKRHTSYVLGLNASMNCGVILETMGIAVDKGSTIMYMPYFKKLSKKLCCRKAFLRGAFLAGGSISDPEKTYHLEISTHSKELAEELSTLINGFKLNAKVISRKGNFVCYLKEGENIVDFLNIIGAHSALLELENVRILKGMRNNVNRIVNCETANLEKTVNASIRQVDNIKFIKDHIGFENIPKNLREIAELRLRFIDSSLTELGEMLNPPLGKSGVNHRLRKLDSIAEKARNLRG
ncbi:MAG: DNA-binding protein WhiA [Clostridia bacterium]|nr:DNA-binding protein WhiA [Clostridia bacterium]